MTLVQTGHDSGAFLRHHDNWWTVGVVGRRTVAAGWEVSKVEIVVGADGMGGRLSAPGFAGFWLVRPIWVRRRGG